MALTSQREIERINQFEKEWKINTNINKSNVLTISKSRPEAISREGRRVPFPNEIKMLGLTIKRTGVSQHITNRIKQAKAQTTKLKRFIRLDSSIKLHLYKALLRPVMEYPIIPNGITSDMNMMKMQSKNGVLHKLKHIFPNTYQRIKSICSPAKVGTCCYRF